MPTSIERLLPDDGEVGASLALRNDEGQYLFFLAGSQFDCPPGKRFYAGIGGHLEDGETLVECARREADEEVGADVALQSASETYHLPHDGEPAVIDAAESPRPLAVYEMAESVDGEPADDVYYIVVYEATLRDGVGELAPDEVSGVMGLTPRQVARGTEREPTVATLLDEGATIVESVERIPRDTTLYAVGTARALAEILDELDRT